MEKEVVLSQKLLQVALVLAVGCCGIKGSPLPPITNSDNLSNISVIERD